MPPGTPRNSSRLPRPRFTWRMSSTSMELGERTRVMGILNVTPDSFSDGGRLASPQQAVDAALQQFDEGADIVDIGGESTRPGKKEPVTAQMELERVLPVIEGILAARPGSLLSVDTYKSEVAARCIKAGAQIVNDVSGFQWDSNMADTVATHGCAAVLMHVRGRPETWRTLPPLTDPVDTVAHELAYFAGVALKYGVPREALVLDPGFGFGKNYEENFPMIAGFAKFHQLGFPLLAGVSRKSFLGKAAGGSSILPLDGRLAASIAAMTACILEGAHIVRVHDVRESVEAARVADAMLAQ